MNTIDLNTAPTWAEALGVIIISGVEQEVWIGQMSYAYIHNPDTKYVLGKPNTFHINDLEILERI